MKNLLIPIAASIAVGIGTASCGNHTESSAKSDSRMLYERSVQTYRNYTDSMAAAADSLDVSRLDDAFESALSQLNFQYPAETDFEITEGENDTLIMMSKRYIFVRDSVLSHFAEHAHLAVDTVELEKEMVIASGNQR